MIRIRLREAIEAHERRTGTRLTYSQIADRTGLSRSTIESIGARLEYNPTLDVIDRLCEVLGCSLGELLERDQTPGGLRR